MERFRARVRHGRGAGGAAPPGRSRGGSVVREREGRVRSLPAVPRVPRVAQLPQLADGPRAAEDQGEEEERRLGGGGADSRAVRYGLFEETIERYVQGACATQELWHSRETRKHCEGIMEAHEDELATAYTRWLKKGAPEETDGWSWNWEVCYKATQSCAEELAMHALSEFDDDGSGASERKYRSEPIPELGAKREGLYHLVAGAFYDAVVKDDTVDVLVYTAFPNADGGDFLVDPSRIGRRAGALRREPDRAGAFRVAMIDAELNDVPPPYGTGSRPHVVSVPGGK